NYKLKQVIFNSTQNFAINNIIIDNSPFPPTNVTAINYTKNKVYLSWTKSIDDGNGNNDVKGYEIYRSTSFLSGFDKIISLSNGVESYIDELSQINTYYYKLFAVDKRSKSVPSKILSVYVSESFFVQTQSSGSITPETGGSAKLDLGSGKSVELTVPPNSVEENVNVTISVVSQYNDNLPQNSQGTNMVYKIEFSKDIILKNPAEIKIFYNDNDIVNLDKQKLRIFWYDEKNGLWRLLDSSVSEVQKGSVRANIYASGTFRVVEYGSPTEDILKDEYVYTFPSPAKGNEVNFKFIIYYPATVKVFVYNVAGEIVWQSKEYEYTLSDVGKTHIIPWNIKKIASGMYIFRVEAKGIGRTKNVVKKMAVIR
ncbi:MAG: fibronectin type III domain-containing protein, partial [Endomicrobiia bacterium]